MSTVPHIHVDLDRQLFARRSDLSLSDIAKMVNEWPVGVTCVTQESDGELLYWDAPLEDVVVARSRAGQRSLLPELGISHQIHSAYCNLESPLLAYDWDSVVVPAPRSRS